MPANPERPYRSTDLSYTRIMKEANEIVEKHAIEIFTFAEKKGEGYEGLVERAANFVKAGLRIPDTKPGPKPERKAIKRPERPK